MASTSKVVWFVAGASIGATIALLFAPQSGEETRRYLGKQAKRGGDALADAGRDALDKGRDLYQRGRRMADDLADDATELLDRGRRALDG